MKKPFLAKILSTAVTLFVLPAMSLAQSTQTAAQKCDAFKKQFSGAFDWVNPAYCSASSVALYATKIILQFSGIVAVIFIMIGGFFYLASAGNEEQAEKGKSILINAVIGLVVIILATTIVTIISSLVATGQ